MEATFSANGFKFKPTSPVHSVRADARITEQCRANCICDNACLVRDGIKRDRRQLYLLYATLTPVPTGRLASRISCGLSCVLPSLTLTRRYRDATVEFPITKLVRASSTLTERREASRNGIGSLFSSTGPDYKIVRKT